jgi:predicted DNA-binding transcriptional regulator AlpA
VKKARALPRIAPLRGELLTLPEAASRIRQSENWIYTRIAMNKLPFNYIRPPEGRICFDSADLDDWISLGMIEGRSGKAQLNPQNVQEWFERLIEEMADMKRFVESYTGRKVRVRLNELEGN